MVRNVSQKLETEHANAGIVPEQLAGNVRPVVERNASRAKRTVDRDENADF